MNRQLSFFLLLSLFLFIFSCKIGTNEQGREPAVVQFVPPVPDTSRIERGIDAVPETDAVFLQWFPSADELVRKYEIYRAESLSSPFRKVMTVHVPDSTCEDSDVSVYVRYYYYIRAVSADDAAGQPSDTISYRLVKKAADLSVNDGSDPGKPSFSWRDPNDPPEGGYILRLAEEPSGDYVWLMPVASSYSNGAETVQYNADGTALYDTLPAGREYRWRIDVVPSSANSGSESQWHYYVL